MTCSNCGPSCEMYAEEFGNVNEEKFYSCRGRDFHPNAMEHFRNPRNSNFDDEGNQILNEKDPNVYYGTFGEFSKCGDEVEIWIKLSEDKSTFEDIRWCTSGCAGAISSASYTSELLKGTKVSDFNIQTMMQSIRDHLHLMNGKEHCAAYPLLSIKACLENAGIEVK